MVNTLELHNSIYFILAETNESNQRGRCMLGVVANSVAILVGGTVGLYIRGGIKEKYKNAIMQAVGLSILFIGLAGALANLIKPGAHPILFIVSMVIGGLIGEWIDIEAKLVKFGDFVESKFGKKESSISRGFVAATLLFCVGSMAILGSFESGTKDVHTILFAKSILDCVISMIFASTLGVGVLLSGVSVLIYEGTLALAASFAEPYLTDDMLREISIVCGILIAALALDLMEIKKIKVGNFLPAVLVPVFYYIVVGLF